MNKKQIKTLDLIFVVGTILSFALLFEYTSPLVISPLGDYETNSREILFSLKNVDSILIDDNLDFSSPLLVEINEDEILTFEPGLYYWKIDSVLDSEVRSFTINSLVDLRILNENGSLYVLNAGNVVLDVDVYENESLIENFNLEREDKFEFNASKIVGREDEN
jgi:hypothetical protein